MQPVSVPTSLLIFKDLRVRGFWMSRDGALPTVEVGSDWFSLCQCAGSNLRSSLHPKHQRCHSEARVHAGAKAAWHDAGSRCRADAAGSVSATRCAGGRSSRLSASAAE